jgi:endonuclease G
MAVRIDWNLRTGFDPTFLGVSTPPPEPRPPIVDDLLLVDGRTTIDYVHFSVAMSRSRKLARWVAWNIDGPSLRELSREGSGFRLDPRVPPDQQVGQRAYSANELDNGHLARRADLLWGAADEVANANHDSFYFTNITPQMEGFNQSARDGVWGRLENAILAQVEDERVCVMGGPLLRADDPPYRQNIVRIPRQFWKLLLYRKAGKVKYKAFRVKQKLDGLRPIGVFPEFESSEVTLAKLERLTRLNFGPATAHAEPRPHEALVAETDESPPIKDVADIDW